ncbi:MAG: putative toxin-antitoxin system toxin component, PIN family [Coriobacteriia bacterium]|nr:putative toxin-antitoxin system toxin component, PIN family [Coriobacteriia bacterium]
MSRVVLDTNVFISAYGFGGKPAELLRACIVGEHVLVTSPAILAEVADKLYEVLGFDDEHVREALKQVVRIGEVVRPDAELHVVADEPDNRVLECAVAGGADFIVSGDRHLLDLGEYEGIRVVRVAEIVDEY